MKLRCYASTAAAVIKCLASVVTLQSEAFTCRYVLTLVAHENAFRIRTPFSVRRHQLAAPPAGLEGAKLTPVIAGHIFRAGSLTKQFLTGAASDGIGIHLTFGARLITEGSEGTMIDAHLIDRTAFTPSRWWWRNGFTGITPGVASLPRRTRIITELS